MHFFDPTATQMSREVEHHYQHIWRRLMYCRWPKQSDSAHQERKLTKGCIQSGIAIGATPLTSLDHNLPIPVVLTSGAGAS